MEAFENIFLEYWPQYWLPIAAIMLGIGRWQINREHDRRLSALDKIIEEYSDDPEMEDFFLHYHSLKADIVSEKHFSLIQALLMGILVLLIAIFLK